MNPIKIIVQPILTVLVYIVGFMCIAGLIHMGLNAADREHEMRMERQAVYAESLRGDLVERERQKEREAIEKFCQSNPHECV